MYVSAVVALSILLVFDQRAYDTHSSKVIIQCLFQPHHRPNLNLHAQTHGESGGKLLH